MSLLRLFKVRPFRGSRPRDSVSRGVAATAVNVLLALVLLAVAAWGRARFTPATISGQSEFGFWQKKILATGPYPIVIAGDSRVYRGAAPEQLAEGLGVPVERILNFGFSANGYGDRYLERLDELIGGGEPRMLILSITPGSLTPNSFERNGFLDWDARFAGDRSSFGRLKRQATSWLEEIARLPPLRPIDERELRQLIGQRRTPRAYYQEYRPTGWVASRTEENDQSFYIERFHRKFSGNTVSASAIENLLEAVHRWRERGIEVYGIRMPLGGALRETEDELSGIDWPGLVAAFNAAGGTWIDLPLEGYETYDGNHLLADEARRFSFDLGRAIARRRSAEPTDG